MTYDIPSHRYVCVHPLLADARLRPAVEHPPVGLSVLRVLQVQSPTATSSWLSSRERPLPRDRAVGLRTHMGLSSHTWEQSQRCLRSINSRWHLRGRNIKLFSVWRHWGVLLYTFYFCIFLLWNSAIISCCSWIFKDTMCTFRHFIWMFKSPKKLT